MSSHHRPNSHDWLGVHLWKFLLSHADMCTCMCPGLCAQGLTKAASHSILREGTVPQAVCAGGKSCKPLVMLLCWEGHRHQLAPAYAETQYSRCSVSSWLPAAGEKQAKGVHVGVGDEGIWRKAVLYLGAA